MTTKPTHGGKRQGSGRPKSEPTETLSYRVKSSQRAEIDSKIRELLATIGKVFTAK